MFEIDFVSDGEAHARTLVDDQLTAQISLFLVTFHKEFLRPAIQFPVDMTNRLSRVVESVFGKLHGEAMERTFVESRDEAFHNLPCQKLQASKLGKPVPIDAKVQSYVMWSPRNDAKHRYLIKVISQVFR